MDVLAQQRVGDLGGAAVGHVLDLDAGGELEQFGREMQAVADAGRAIEHAVLPGVGDQLGDAVHRQRGMHQEEVTVEHARSGDRGEVAQHVEVRILVDERRRGDRRGRKQQRIAVRVGLRHCARRDGAVGADPILDDEALAEVDGELAGDRARDHVGAAARREADHHADRLHGIGLRLRCPGGDCGDRRQHQGPNQTHKILPSL